MNMVTTSSLQGRHGGCRSRQLPGGVAAEEYREDGVFYRATVKIDDLHRFEPFLV
jgi:hypothetical protein